MYTATVRTKTVNVISRNHLNSRDLVKHVVFIKKLRNILSDNNLKGNTASLRTPDIIKAYVLYKMYICFLSTKKCTRVYTVECI